MFYEFQSPNIHSGEITQTLLTTLNANEHSWHILLDVWVKFMQPQFSTVITTTNANKNCTHQWQPANRCLACYNRHKHTSEMKLAIGSNEALDETSCLGLRHALSKIYTVLRPCLYFKPLCLGSACSPECCLCASFALHFLPLIGVTSFC